MRLSYVADIPGTTSLALSVRTGPTATPDGSWTSFAPVAQGGDVTTSGRYLQYQVEATTSSAGVTPTLSSVTVAYSASTETETVPGAPTVVSAVAGNAQATVSWTAPAFDGGSPITGYEITAFDGVLPLPPVAFDSTATTQTMTGLTNGTSYVFTVRAINAVGSSVPSLASNAVVPATVPGAPTIGTAVAGNLEATVSWTAPASNGGSSITGYEVTPYIGATAQTPIVFSSPETTQSVTGLTIDTTYTFRVAAINGVGSGAQSDASNPVVPFGAATDTSVAHFTAGTTGASTYVSDTAGGEVILAPTVGAEFGGTTLPSGWSVNPWSGGGGANVTGGSVTVDQAAIWTDTFYTSDRSVEFVANFSDPNQHIGFANDFNSGQWAIFSTGASGDQLYARSNVPGGVDTPLGAGYLDGLHRFRIEWTAESARYLIDGIEVAFHTGLTFGTSLRPAASDSNASGSLSIDWMRMTPYASPGTFLSRIHDAGSPAANWGALSYVADVPSGTTLGLEVRTGETPTPDGSWSSFAPIASGQDVAASGRYLQYRVEATSASGDATPTLSSVTVPYHAAPLPVVVPGGAGIVEGNAGTKVLQVPVTLSAPSAVPVTVQWSTFDGSGQPAVGVDYDVGVGDGDVRTGGHGGDGVGHGAR